LQSEGDRVHAVTLDVLAARSTSERRGRPGAWRDGTVAAVIGLSNPYCRLNDDELRQVVPLVQDAAMRTSPPNRLRASRQRHGRRMTGARPQPDVRGAQRVT